MKNKTRISVTMTQTYVESLDKLIEEGLYLNRGQIIREGLRYIFKGYGVVPFAKEAEDSHAREKDEK